MEPINLEVRVQEPYSSINNPDNEKKVDNDKISAIQAVAFGALAAALAFCLLITEVTFSVTLPIALAAGGLTALISYVYSNYVGNDPEPPAKPTPEEVSEAKGSHLASIVTYTKDEIDELEKGWFEKQRFYERQGSNSLTTAMYKKDFNRGKSEFEKAVNKVLSENTSRLVSEEDKNQVLEPYRARYGRLEVFTSSPKPEQTPELQAKESIEREVKQLEDEYEKSIKSHKETKAVEISDSFSKPGEESYEIIENAYKTVFESEKKAFYLSISKAILVNAAKFYEGEAIHNCVKTFVDHYELKYPGFSKAS